MSKMAAEDLTSVSIPISRDYSSPSPSLTTWKRGSRGRGLHSVKKQHRTEYETLELSVFQSLNLSLSVPGRNFLAFIQDVRYVLGDDDVTLAFVDGEGEIVAVVRCRI
ncbi:hypothetical protein LINPERHAP1_LOCUS27568 [Linum perenne]